MQSICIIFLNNQLSDHKRWCCDTAAIYSDLVPGSLKPLSEEDSELDFGTIAEAEGSTFAMWVMLNCEHVVGGATKPNCKGMLSI